MAPKNCARLEARETFFYDLWQKFDVKRFWQLRKFPDNKTSLGNFFFLDHRRPRGAGPGRAGLGPEQRQLPLRKQRCKIQHFRSVPITVGHLY